ncbi:MAG: hypothetical protein KIS95_12290 [Anaerolineae bacterium]|uniref:hypothetical protein n=1 Tax=Promineifilum sp. TaxID=2664178 RepID=UPI001DA718D3|nr:hypothetical protein [Anaerolineales bacterium]MCO5178911.1 hypothetical protein [Promineifilum sp.]MCW5848005.1 hypothetical protein [Anaerolineae bacterium]
MSEKETLKITLDDVAEENPPAAITERGKLRDGAADLGHKVGDAVKGSAARVATKIADTTTEATSRSAEAVRDKVGEAIQAQSKATADAVEARLREIDWKGEAQKGAEGGLRWLSQRLEELAEKMRGEEKKPAP